MKKVLLATPFPLQDDDLNTIANFGYDVQTCFNFQDPTEDMFDAEVIVGLGHYFQKHLDSFGHLKMMQLCSAGFDRVPLEEVAKRGIILCNAKGVYSIPVAEWVILKTLEIYKDTRYFTELQKQSTWKMNRDLQELDGKTMGIIGTGSIGTEVAKRAAAFGCKVIGLNTMGTKRECFEECQPKESLPDFLALCDIVVLTLPYSEQSHNLLNRETLAFLKDDAVLINIARGGIVNENDLLDVLASGKLKGVALDVFEQEPLPKSSPLWQHERVLVTPHNSFASERIEPRLRDLILINLEAYSNKFPLKNLVNLQI
jgi:phosphoglycerate dehydrogenase-like enzyme